MPYQHYLYSKVKYLCKYIYFNKYLIQLLAWVINLLPLTDLKIKIPIIFSSFRKGIESPFHFYIYSVVHNL